MSLLHHLGGLSPFGPIFGKELRATARRKRNYLLRILYLGGLLLILLMAYAAVHDSNSSVMARQQRQQELGAVFFAMFSMFCVISMAVISPVLTSTAISSERLHKTLAILLMTPITSWQIISGKLFSRLLTSLMLIGLSLPVLALVRLLGGVELRQMFGVICLCIITALFTASIGLFYSTFMNRAYAVILLSYATIGFLYLFVPFILVMFSIANKPNNTLSALSFFAAVNPFFNTMILAFPDSRMMLRIGFVPCVIVHLIGTAMLVTGSGLVLRRLIRREGEKSLPPASPALPIALPGAPPNHPRDTPKARIISDNPVLWREIRRPLMARRWQAIVGGVLCIILLLFSYAALGSEDILDDSETQIGFAFVFNALGMLLVCVLSATAIAQEKESDTWTLLLATPIKARAIVLGKFLGLLRRMLWPSVLVAGHFLAFTLTGIISIQSLFMTLWVIFTFNAIWIASGLYLSLRLKKVTFAVILNLLLPVIFYAAVPAVLGVTGELISSDGDDWAEIVCWYLPYHYLGMGVDDLSTRSSFYSLDRSVWMPVPAGNISAETFLLFVFYAGLIHLGIAAFILWNTIRRFDRIVGRARQHRREVGLEAIDSNRVNPLPT